MANEGNLVVVLNGPDSRAGLVNFARAVFEFPSATLMVCSSDKRMKGAINLVHRIAYSGGRSFMSAESFDEVLGLFRPERVVYVDSSHKSKLEVEGLKGDLRLGKTIALVFGAPVAGERIGLEMNINSAASAAVVVLYEMMRREYGPVV